VRIEQLEYVAAVARLGSYRRAAEALHISQPALSESVRSLERELGADLLERGRHGARASSAGRELLPLILGVLDSVDRLRLAADGQHRSSRAVRVGTVNTATVPLLVPAIREFRQAHRSTLVEVVGGMQADIQRGLLEGSTDLGLINYLDGDDMPPELETTPLLTGRPVVCMPPDSPLAARAEVAVGELRAATLIAMRPGYVMHRYLHRLLAGDVPGFSYSADGAEMGKLMVAEGLGLTVLPDFSVIGDPLETRGVITWRPVAGDQTRVQLVIQRLRSGCPPEAARDLHRIFLQRARAAQSALAGPALRPPRPAAPLAAPPDAPLAQPDAPPAAALAAGDGQGSR
jgi:DNA-binding transcriptional LysR family regulator